MNQPLFITFLILILTIAFIIHGKYRVDLIALVGLVVLGLTRVLTLEELLAGFANPVVIIVAALFVISAGIFNSGLIDEIGNYLLRFGQRSESNIIIYSDAYWRTAKCLFKWNGNCCSFNSDCDEPGIEEKNESFPLFITAGLCK